MTFFGGIEAGGTKFVCAVATGPDDIQAETRFATTTPAACIGRAVAFFQEQQAAGIELEAMGIASFGPVDPDPDSPTFGYITSTPKEGWANTDFAGAVAHAMNLPVGFDTDVNAAALGEGRWGAGRGLHTFIYLTVGTGIGGGGLVKGDLMHGLIHPEMGHIRIPHDTTLDPFPGVCPYHADCLEGLASGPAIEQRWGRPARELSADHEAWDLEAHYLALALHNYICTLSPQRIILGGGVMEQVHLFPKIRQHVQTLLNGYIQSPDILENIDDYIVPPVLGGDAGVLGAIALAERARDAAKGRVT